MLVEACLAAALPLLRAGTRAENVPSTYDRWMNTLVPRSLSRFFAAATTSALVLAGGIVGATAAEAAPLTLSCEVTGKIFVTKLDGSPGGWLSKTWNRFGEYVMSALETDAVTVTTTVGSRQLLRAVDGPNPALPYIGGVVGYTSASNDIALGSANHTFLAGMGATVPGSPAVAGPNSFTDANNVRKDIQSAIWTLGSDLSLSAQWINTDGSAPATSTVMEHTGIMILSGDPAAFTNRFNGVQTTLSVVPQATTCGTLTLSPHSATMTAGQSHTFTTSFDDGDGSVSDTTASTVYTSSNAGDAFSGNVLTATTAGTRTITATHNGFTATATVTVTPSAATVIAITPRTATASADSTTPFTTTAEDPYGNLTDVTATTVYASSNAGDAFSGNVLTATTAGTRTITATHGRLTSTATLTVSAGTMQSIELALSGLQVNQGGSITATVEGFDAAGNTLGDLSTSVTLTSDQPTDVIVGSTITFPHASVHVITATLGQHTSSVSITVIPTAAPAAAAPPVPHPGDLGATGVDPTGTVIAALILLVAGAGALIVSRRPRTSR